jgi:phage terminase small subunit
MSTTRLSLSPVALNPKRARFVTAYLKTGNATQAATSAGYSEKSARSTGYDLLRNPDVAQAIGNAAQGAAITAERIIGRLGEFAFDGDRDQVAVKALELLGKHQKLFTDKVEASGANGGALEIIIRKESA